MDSKSATETSSVVPSSGLASFQSTSRTVSWNDRRISYTIVPKDAAAKADTTVTTVLMAGNALARDLNGATHALQFETHEWEKLSPEDQKALAAATGKVGTSLLNHTNPEVAQAIDMQFEPDAAEKVKATFSSVLPLLEQTAKANESGSAKISFEHGGRKFKIYYQRKEDGSAEILCVGSKLGAGGGSTVLKMVGIGIPKSLEEQARAWAGVYYKPLEEDQPQRNSVAGLLAAIPKDSKDLPEITKLAERLRKLSKKNPNDPTALANMSEHARQELEKVKKEELEVYKELRELVLKQKKPDPPPKETAENHLENIRINGHCAALAKAERRLDIARGFEIYKVLTKLGIPHIMEYHGVRMKDGEAVGSWAKIYEGDLNVIIGKPLKTPADRLERLRLIKQLVETVRALHKAGLVIVDFKPGNIFWKGQAIFLGDLAGITLKGTPKGGTTPQYADANLHIGRLANPKSDMYALGLIMYEMLHGPINPEDRVARWKPDQYVRNALTKGDPKAKIKDPNDAMILRLIDAEKPEKRPDAASVFKMVDKEISRAEKELKREAKKAAPSKVAPSKAAATEGPSEASEEGFSVTLGDEDRDELYGSSEGQVREGFDADLKKEDSAALYESAPKQEEEGFTVDLGDEDRAELYKSVDDTISSSLETVSDDKQASIDTVAASPQSASPDQVKSAAVAIEASTAAATNLGRILPGEGVASPLGVVVQVNGHTLFVNHRLIIVGDIQASSDKEKIEQEMKAVLDAALESPNISDETKALIRSSRERGSVCSMDQATTLAARKEAVSMASSMVRDVRETGEKVAKALEDFPSREPVATAPKKMTKEVEEQMRKEDAENAEKIRGANDGEKKAPVLEIVKNCQRKIDNPETPLTECVALNDVVEALPKELGLGSDSSLQLDIEKFDFGEAGKLIKTRSGRLLAKGPVDVLKLKLAIKASSYSEEDKSWLLSKIEAGQIEIPTEQEMQIIEQMKKQLHHEFLTFIMTWIEENREGKKVETKKKIGTSLAVTQVQQPLKVDIEKVALGIAKNFVQKTLSRNRQRDEIAQEIRWRKKDAEYRKEVKLLEQEAVQTAQYYIKEYIKRLLREGEYTEEELKKLVNAWLESREETSLEDSREP